MSIRLICDAPNCMETTLAVVKLNRPAAPDGWWMQTATKDRIVVACCEQHFNDAVKRLA